MSLEAELQLLTEVAHKFKRNVSLEGKIGQGHDYYDTKIVVVHNHKMESCGYVHDRPERFGTGAWMSKRNKYNTFEEAVRAARKYIEKMGESNAA